ncbi:hypothetical protein E2562_001141 [Oryza meyeriana var. granulata]|uniref:Uncharacterized protein n=1 Tax=Oryza meyeriana var. granulata TaxID=110450 RepID=A0A6G1EEB8_9ORYZ|nr:hypothetical protein E2562_001141 [Oryza meyeriana var. granulata]
MASPTTVESHAGQPATTYSPRALFTKLPSTRPASVADRDDHARLSLLASLLSSAGFSGFSAAAAHG